MKVKVVDLKDRDVIQLTPTLQGVVGQIFKPHTDPLKDVYVYVGICSGLHPADISVHVLPMKLTDEVELIAVNIRQRQDFIPPHRDPPERFWG